MSKRKSNYEIYPLGDFPRLLTVGEQKYNIKYGNRKQCTNPDCMKIKPISEFYISTLNMEYTTHSNRCKECTRKAKNQRYRMKKSNE